MTNTITEYHVHLPADLPPGSVVHLHLATQAVAQPAAESTAMPADIEAKLTRLRNRAIRERGTAAFDGLVSLGYEPFPSKPRSDTSQQTYLRWADKGSTIGYLNSATMEFSRPADRDRLLALPGAMPKLRGVRFSIRTDQEVAHMLAAAELIHSS